MKIHHLKPLALAALITCHLMAHATQPSGATVVNGSATINTFRDGVQVINSPGAIINWDSFSVGAGQTARFDQLTANSAVLNRVTGGRSSEIFGTLQSNGRVFLINPNGILFGNGSRVDTAGLVASTLDISNEDFLAGQYRFRCANTVACEAGVDALNPINGRIVLKDGSEITTRNAGNGGQVWLIARDRITSEKGSKIDAPGGQVIAATAREVSVTSPSVGNMRFTLTGSTNTRIDLAGDIDVARGAAGFFADTIRLAGKVSALSEVGAAGQISAQAATDVVIGDDARLNVSGIPAADAGAIRLTAGQKITVTASSELAADGGTFTAQESGARGGLISLQAAEVVLPSQLSETYTPLQLHANGSNAHGLEAARNGEILVEESGQFNYSIVDGFSMNQRYEVTNGFPVATFAQTQARIETQAKSGDGQLAVISRLDDHERVDEFGIPSSYTGITEVRLNILNPDGTLKTQRTLVSESYDPIARRGYGLYGLAKGGWVLLEVSPDKTYTLRFISSTGDDIRSIRLFKSTAGDLGVAGFQPLLNGGILVESMAGFFPKTVFDAQGVVQPDIAAVLAGESAVAYNRSYAGISFVDRAGAKAFASGAGFNGMQVGFTSNVTQSGANSFSATSVLGVTDTGVFNSIRSYTSTGEEQGERFIGSSAIAGNFRDHGSNQVSFIEDRFSGDTYLSTTGSFSFKTINRQRTNSNMIAESFAVGMLTPTLLTTAPGQGNGTATASSGSGSGGSSGTSGGSTAPSFGPVGLSLPPPPAPISKPKSAGTSVKPGTGVDAAILTAPPGDGGRKELLDAAADLVEAELGKEMADNFRAAETPEERGIILQEVADAQVLGPEVYGVVKRMDPEMSDAFFEGWSILQQAGLEQEPGVSEGLMTALTEKRDGGTNPDGSPGVARTPLEVPLSILEAEMFQAKTPEARARVRNLITRELVLAGRAEAGKEADDTADVVLADANGKKTRITPEGDLIRE